MKDGTCDRGFRWSLCNGVFLQTTMVFTGILYSEFRSVLLFTRSSLRLKPPKLEVDRFLFLFSGNYDIFVSRFVCWVCFGVK